MTSVRVGQSRRRHPMAMTLLGISGSLTRGGSTRTAIDCALRAAQQRYPEISTAVLDLRDVAHWPFATAGRCTSTLTIPRARWP